MKVIFRTRDPQGNGMRNEVERRVRFVFRRLGWQVPRAEVHLSDLNGPRGGRDKRCQLEVKTQARGLVVVSSVARDWRAALDAALARAIRSVVRRIKRVAPARTPRAASPVPQAHY
ncbi:HPF/RaiA family ribosome-associated protein [Acidovorax sp.]|uniref:HPF/RaiA family ribosome-associated protein n=1 Tax=Acidovorax sp. TaxID=1872122 RepID=UPI00391EF02E